VVVVATPGMEKLVALVSLPILCVRCRRPSTWMLILGEATYLLPFSPSPETFVLQVIFLFAGRCSLTSKSRSRYTLALIVRSSRALPRACRHVVRTLVHCFRHRHRHRGDCRCVVHCGVLP
jgi:hypothetical protein